MEKQYRCLHPLLVEKVSEKREKVAVENPLSRGGHTQVAGIRRFFKNAVCRAK